MEDQTKILQRIEKLMKLGKNNTNEHEATAALEMAQKLADAYNIDVATIGGSGPNVRSEKRFAGGLYAYQRTLYRAIAELNHCVYWSEKGIQRGEKYQHRVLGSPINVLLVNQMAEYLQGAIEHVTRTEYCHGVAQDYFKKNSHIFREGMVDRIVLRLQRQRDVEREEQRKRRDAEMAAHPGLGHSIVIIDDVAERERAANFNYQHGEGAWERIEADRAARAMKRLEAEEAYAKWAAENPEEAAKQAQQQADEMAAASAKWAKESAKREARRKPQVARISAKEAKYYTDAYRTGYDKGDQVGLDKQVSGTTVAGELE